MLSIPMDALAGMIELATIDGASYLRLDLVVRLDRDADVPAYYCCAHDWPASDIARLVEARRHAADLERTNAQLAERVVELERALAAARATPREAPSPCPECGRAFTNPPALVMHRMRKHGYRKAIAEHTEHTEEATTQNGHTPAEEASDAAPLA